MKLTQNAAGKTGTAPAQSDLAGRLARVEQRMERAERAPLAASASLDPGVLDAIMRALEARLQENAGQLDRRLAELEVKMAIAACCTCGRISKGLREFFHETAQWIVRYERRTRNVKRSGRS